MPISDIENYFRTWDKSSYSVFAQQGFEPAESEIVSFEDEIGFRLPEEFRQYLLHPLGGLYMEVKEELWPRGKLYEVGPAWSFLYGFYCYSFSQEAPDWMNLRSAWQDMSESGSPHLVPFLRILSDADPYCFTREGKIVIWRHETPAEPDSVEGTFSEIFMEELRALEDRKARKLAGEAED